MERQAILGRLGWRFVRIRGSVFFRDRESTMAKVFAKLDELRVFPTARDVQAEAIGEALQDPVEDVIRLAAELRSQWEESESRGDTPVNAEVVDETDAAPVGQEVLSDAESHFDDVRTSPSEVEESQMIPQPRLDDPPFPVDGRYTKSQSIATADTASSPPGPAPKGGSTGKPSNVPRKYLFDDLDESEATEATSLQQRIVQLVSRQPGLKGREIANALGVDRREVNSTLHRHLSLKLHQDEEARWWPRSNNLQG